jgi:hypothetical protein
MLRTLIISDFNETLIFSTDFQNVIKYRFQEHSYVWCHVVPRGRRDEQANLMKLIDDFRNSMNAPKSTKKYEIR